MLRERGMAALAQSASTAHTSTQPTVTGQTVVRSDRGHDCIAELSWGVGYHKMRESADRLRSRAFTPHVNLNCQYNIRRSCNLKRYTVQSKEHRA